MQNIGIIATPIKRKQPAPGAFPAGAPRPAALPADSSHAFRHATLRRAHADPAAAATLARDFAYDRSYATGGPRVDISGYPTLRYACTGEPVTHAGMADFLHEAARVTASRIDLYEAEVRRGTDDAAILEKLYRHTDAQSTSYLAKIGWTRLTEPGIAPN